MKKLLTIAACALSLSMLAACSGLDRSKEEALNRQAGIEVTQTKEGVQVRLPEKVLFNFNESSLRPDAGPAIARRGALAAAARAGVLLSDLRPGADRQRRSRCLYLRPAREMVDRRRCRRRGGVGLELRHFLSLHLEVATVAGKP